MQKYGICRFIKNICDKYFGYEENKMTEILITHTHKNTLKIIMDYVSMGTKDHLQNFVHIVNYHTNTWTSGTNYMDTSRILQLNNILVPKKNHKLMEFI